MIVLGRITAPYGIRGWLKLHAFGDDPASWRGMKRWWLGQDDQDHAHWQIYPLVAMRQQGSAWVVKLGGIEDRSTAEAMAGMFVGAPRDELPPTGKDEYYWGDLIGLQVINEEQEVLGRVSEMMESAAHAVMVVTDGVGKHICRRLLPFVAQVVKRVDVPGGRVTVDWQKDW